MRAIYEVFKLVGALLASIKIVSIRIICRAQTQFGWSAFSESIKNLVSKTEKSFSHIGCAMNDKITIARQLPDNYILVDCLMTAQ